jgi:poly(ADP-ribose) glycohydrolase ARH3
VLDTDKVYGCLLGLVWADAVGARFEGLSPEQIRSSYKDKRAALSYSSDRESLKYTDDGQMALALAEYLTIHDRIESDSLMRSFVEVYEPWRGYGRGARVLIEAYRDNADYEFMAQHLFPGGSLGNGAAMRSAPVGLKFSGDDDRIWEESRMSAWPTHRHELGIEGAQLIAMAISLAMGSTSINPKSLAAALNPRCKTVVFENRLKRLATIENENEIQELGNGIEAHESVVTALAIFSLYPEDYSEAIATAIWQGGDTDTIAAMTGALVGARVGSQVASGFNMHGLEDGEEFLTYLFDLSERLA